jgi:hypothetical protein
VQHRFPPKFPMPLVQLLGSNGTYDQMKAGWREQCEAAGEEFEFYAQGTFLVLDPLVVDPSALTGHSRSAVYGIQRGDVPEIICLANWVRGLPGQPEPVLRVRLLTMSPAIDFGTAADAKSRYVDNLADLFYGIIELSQGDMPAGEIKIHLRSPEDFNFFRIASRELADFAGFSRVEMKGAWLYISVAS